MGYDFIPYIMELMYPRYAFTVATEDIYIDLHRFKVRWFDTEMDEPKAKENFLLGNEKDNENNKYKYTDLVLWLLIVGVLSINVW